MRIMNAIIFSSVKNMTVFAAILLFVACGGSNKSTETTAAPAFDITAAKNHIAEMNKKYGDRFFTGDSAFFEKRYCADAAVMSPQMPTVSGREAVRKFYYNDGKNKDITIEIIAGNVYGGAEAVVEEGTYNFPDGKGGSIDKGKFIAIWKQEAGQWKLYREIWNTDMPPPAQ